MFFPYRKRDGTFTQTDEQMVELFETFEREGTINNIFRDGCIATPEDFINLFKNSEDILYFVVIDDKIGGIIWLNCFEGKRAHIHFNSLKYTWGRKAYAAGREAIKVLSTVWPCLIGITPIDNPLALRFIKKMGMKEVGIIPGAIYDDALNEDIDGVLTYYVKEE